MRRISETFQAQNNAQGVDLTFDVVAVHTWQQLVARARTSRWVSTFQQHWVVQGQVVYTMKHCQHSVNFGVKLIIGSKNL